MRHAGKLLVASIFCVSASIPAFSEDGTIQFRKTKIKIDKQVLEVELAETFEEQSRGLMFRKKIADNEGMLFIYRDENVRNFWMKNTFIPLSIGFFDGNRVLVDIQDMTPVASEMQVDVPSYQSRQKAKYALEVAQGWFKRHNIKPKARFDFVSEKSGNPKKPNVKTDNSAVESRN